MSNAEDTSCGYAYIGDIKCGVVNQVTSVNVTLWPPSDTTYEITTVWEDVNDSGQIDSFVNYYTNITEAKTITLTVMFTEPDTQNLSITVRAYNDNYRNDDVYDTFSASCYETVKPSKGDKYVWAVEVGTYDCKETWLESASSTSYGWNVSSSVSNVPTKFCMITGFIVLASLSVLFVIFRKKKVQELQMLQTALASDSLLNKSVSERKRIGAVKKDKGNVAEQVL